MYVEPQFLHSKFVGDVVNLSFQRVGKEERGLNRSFAHTGGAFFFDMNVHGGTNTLACNLHESELRERQDVVLGTIGLHQFGHVLIEFLAMFGCIHVDEIDDDDTSDVGDYGKQVYDGS